MDKTSPAQSLSLSGATRNFLAFLERTSAIDALASRLQINPQPHCDSVIGGPNDPATGVAA